MSQIDYTFKLKSWHFILAMIMLFSLTTAISKMEIKQMPSTTLSSNLTEVSEIDFKNKDVNIVLFYDGNSDICSKMRFNLEKLAESPQKTVHFYAIDVTKHPKPFYEYNVSGIPNILIFKNNREIKRIMGIVSRNNLEKIVEKTKSTDE